MTGIDNARRSHSFQLSRSLLRWILLLRRSSSAAVSRRTLRTGRVASRIALRVGLTGLPGRCLTLRSIVGRTIVLIFRPLVLLGFSCFLILRAVTCVALVSG